MDWISTTFNTNKIDSRHQMEDGVCRMDISKVESPSNDVVHEPFETYITLEREIKRQATNWFPRDVYDIICAYAKTKQSVVLLCDQEQSLCDFQKPLVQEQSLCDFQKPLVQEQSLCDFQKTKIQLSDSQLEQCNTLVIMADVEQHVEIPVPFMEFIIRGVFDFCDGTTQSKSPPSHIPKPLPCTTLSAFFTLLQPWERRWLHTHVIHRSRPQMDKLIAFIECSEWLGVYTLSQLCGATVAVMLRGKSSRDMRLTLQTESSPTDAIPLTENAQRDNLWVCQWQANVFPIVSPRYCQK
jgi:hypothetical protein